MKMFTEGELALIEKLRSRPPLTVLQIRKPCPTHSVCSPLPLFRIYKIDESSFEAQWNGYHEAGVRQTFVFAEAGNS